VKRPVILNGIEDVAARPDLAERALQIELETIPDNRRISERKLWQNFELARPAIFAAILNGLVCALRELPGVKFASLPRMADAVLWATAGETALGWERGMFNAAYQHNLKDGAIASVDAHPVGVAIRQLLDGQLRWSGQPAELLKVLNGAASDETKHATNWPKNPKALSACLRRLAQAIRHIGIQLTFEPSGTGNNRRRGIQLKCRAGELPSHASQAPDAPDSRDTRDAQIQPLHCEKPLVEELI
jgi:hypothetical protein